MNGMQRFFYSLSDMSAGVDVLEYSYHVLHPDWFLAKTLCECTGTLARFEHEAEFTYFRTQMYIYKPYSLVSALRGTIPVFAGWVAANQGLGWHSQRAEPKGYVTPDQGMGLTQSNIPGDCSYYNPFLAIWSFWEPYLWLLSNPNFWNYVIRKPWSETTWKPLSGYNNIL